MAEQQQQQQQQGTEYTLQGVMRFLQIEWHNHERARNAWDIERAEMKAKIAKQEGDCRSAKKLNDLLEKQIKMLEKALKSERAKSRPVASSDQGGPPREDDVKKEWNGRIGVKPSSEITAAQATLTPHNANPALAAFPGIDVDQQSLHALEQEREAQRDKSKVFMQKCVEELTYLLTPPAHPPPPVASHHQGLPNGNDYRPADLISPLQEPYIPHQQAQAQNRRRNVQVSHLPSPPNHAPPPARPHESYNPAQPLPQRAPSSEPAVEQIHVGADMAAEPYEYQHAPLKLANPDDEDVERVTHSFDAYGRPIQSSESVTETRAMVEDANGWNFDDGTALLDPPPPPRTETDQFPTPQSLPPKSPPRTSLSARRKSSGAGSGARRRSTDGKHEIRDLSAADANAELGVFKAKFALRGHLDVVRSVIFTGGGSPSEPEICTAGDDGTVKRWIIPATYGSGTAQSPSPSGTTNTNEPDIQAYFTHRGHDGIVTSLAACPETSSLSTGGRALGDGWIFSGGQDATIRVWERGRVDPKATLEGHTDAIWSVCVLSANAASVLNSSDQLSANPSLSTATPPTSIRDDRILLASGGADRSLRIWAVSAPPQLSSPSNLSGNRRGVGGSRRQSITSGSGFSSTPQPSTASDHPFAYQLIHSIDIFAASPTCISPLSAGGESFVVGFADASVLVFDTRSGEQVVGMASTETYDGTSATGVNSVVVAGTGLGSFEHSMGGPGSSEGDDEVHGATGVRKSGGIEGVVISGHEDRFVRFYDANSGQCTYSMLAHPSSIASLSLSPDGRELMTAGHDASLRFWSLDKRSCSQEMTSHRPMRGEGVTCAVWSHDGRWVVSVGGDGVGKVFGR